MVLWLWWLHCQWWTGGFAARDPNGPAAAAAPTAVVVVHVVVALDVAVLAVPADAWG